MTDSVAAPTPAPAPDASQNIKIDHANVVHDAERDARHGLSHLEGEFLAEWRKMATFSETEAKKLLAWIAGKL